MEEQNMGAALGAIGSSILPMVGKAATNFLVTSLTDKVFGKSGIGGANAGAFSAEQATAGVQEASAILVNKNSNNASIPVVYGRRRIGGTRVFVDTTDGAGDNSGTEYLNIALVVSEGSALGHGWPTKMYFDERLVWDASQSGTLNYTVEYSNGSATGLLTARLENFEDGGVTSVDGTDDDGNTTTSDLKVYWAPGSYVQSGSNSPAEWQTSLGSSVWTNNHKLNGVTVAYIIMQINQAFYEGTVPQITFECDGARICPVDQDFLDDATSAYYVANGEVTGSDGVNPVDALYNYLTDPFSGKGLDFNFTTGQLQPGTDIDLQSFKDARDYCEGTVTRNGQSMKRYRMNGVIQTSATLYENIDMIVNSFNGMLIYTNGKYKLKIRQPNETSIMSFDRNNILGDIELTFSGASSKLNRVLVSYSNPDKTYNDDIITHFDNSYFNADGGKVLEAKVDMPLITEEEQIKDLAQYKIEQSRLAVTVNFTAPHTALIVECGEIIDITHNIFGWNSKKFRVVQQEILADNTVNLIATEYDSTIEI